MSALLDRSRKYMTGREHDLLREVLSKKLRELKAPALKKHIATLRRYHDKARERALAEARKGMSGELSKRKVEIFREALRRCERRLLEMEVKEVREQHRAAARTALQEKHNAKTSKRPTGGRTAGKGMAAKPRKTPVPRLTTGREKGHVLAVQRRGQAKRDNR